MSTRKLPENTFPVELDSGRILLYSPLKRTAFVGNEALINMISDPDKNKSQSDFLNILEQSGFFQPEKAPPDEYSAQGTRYDTVILFLTNQCNLRCTYCYAHSGEYPSKTMDWETAKAAIDFAWKDVIKYDLKQFTLGFHGGGEPSLNWNVLTKSVEYTKSLASKKGVKLNFSGAFNGCWNNNIREYFVRNFTEISLSLDGLPDTQNRQRPRIGDKPSFKDVDQTLRTLDKARIKYGIRMTVTNDSVGMLSENVDFICKNYRPVKIQAEPVFEQGRALENASAVSDLSIFVREFIRAHTIARQRNIELFYSGARLDLLTNRFCLAACRAFVVTTDGDVTTCFESYGREHPLSKYFLVGNYDGKGSFDIDQNKLNNYFNHTVEENAHCHNCFCKWHCAGDCAIKTMRQNGESGYQTTERCYVNREITKYLILDRIKQSGGLVWMGQEAFDKLPSNLRKGLGGGRCC